MNAMSPPGWALPRVWIVDTDPDARLTLRRHLENIDMSSRLFARPEALFAALKHGTPDCLVLEHQFPETTGLEIQQRLLDTNITLSIVFFVRAATIQAAVMAMRLGAVDFIQKHDAVRQLSTAIAAALSASRMQHDRRRAVTRFGRAVQTLTMREREVIDGICSGLRNKQVALSLGISTRTVESHREHAIRKLNVRNTAELVRVYLQAACSSAARDPASPDSVSRSHGSGISHSAVLALRRRAG